MALSAATAGAMVMVRMKGTGRVRVMAKETVNAMVLMRRVMVSEWGWVVR